MQESNLTNVLSRLEPFLSIRLYPATYVGEQKLRKHAILLFLRFKRNLTERHLKQNSLTNVILKLGRHPLKSPGLCLRAQTFGPCPYFTVVPIAAYNNTKTG